MSNPSQLYLLADHIKLSLLERQRAISLDLEPNAQDGNISRSLESMREGIEALEQESDANGNSDQAHRLRTQYDDLSSQFRGFPTTSPALASPNNDSLKPDFAHAQTGRAAPNSSLRSPSGAGSKSVRFTDNKPLEDADEVAARAALFPYRDNPGAEDGPPDQSALSNQGIHAYHTEVIQQQDEQLDRLGHSIGRQRDLSIQIGDELDDHVRMLDDVEEHVDRHMGRLEGARKSLGKVARKANDNKQLTTIAILIIILVLLIIVFK